MPQQWPLNSFESGFRRISCKFSKVSFSLKGAFALAVRTLAASYTFTSSSNSSEMSLFEYQRWKPLKPSSNFTPLFGFMLPKKFDIESPAPSPTDFFSWNSAPVSDAVASAGVGFSADDDGKIAPGRSIYRREICSPRSRSCKLGRPIL